MRIGRIWQETYRSQYFEGGRVLQARSPPSTSRSTTSRARRWASPSTIAAGGKQRDRVPAFASTGDEAEGDAAIARAQELAARASRHPLLSGRQNNKNIFEPRESIGPTARMLNKAREVLGDDIVLGIDYHHRLSVAEAASFCAKLDRGVLDFLEEPIRDETPEPMSRSAG